MPKPLLAQDSAGRSWARVVLEQPHRCFMLVHVHFTQGSA